MKELFDWFRSLFASSKTKTVNTIETTLKKASGKLLSIEEQIIANAPAIKAEALRAALEWRHHPKVKNPSYILLVDFSLNEKFKRSFLIDMKTFKVDAQKVAHGKNSDKDKDGLAESFSNINGSFQSSLGPMVIGAAFYNPKWRYVRLIDGLLKGVNDNVRKREILWHSTAYVNDIDGKMIGDTLGCFGYSEKVAAQMSDKIQGILLFAWHPTFKESSK